MPTEPSPILSLVPIAAIFLIFYFLVIRPQQKQQKDHEKMLEGLQKGDRVVTSGGLYGVIAGFRGPDLELRVADNVKLLLSRSAVARLAPDSGGTAGNGSHPAQAGKKG